MRKSLLVCLIGLVSILLPYLGVPDVLRWNIVTGAGVLLMLLGYLLLRDEILRRSDMGNGERGNDSFVETTAPLFEDHTLQ